MDNNKFVPSVRVINGIEIYFKTKLVVQVRQGSMAINISRWDKPGGGTYVEAWRPFCSKLCHWNRLESIYQVMRLASHYDLMITTAKSPDKPPPDIWIRPTHYIWPAKKPKRKGDKDGARIAQTYRDGR